MRFEDSTRPQVGQLERRYIEVESGSGSGERRFVLVWVGTFFAGASMYEIAVDDRTGRVVRARRGG